MLGLGFLAHGLPKFTAEGHQLFLGALQGMGVPLAEPASWLIGALEVAGALLFLLGYKVRLVVLPLIVDMLVAAIKVHGPNGFNAIHIVSIGPGGVTFGMPGFEFPLLYMVMLVSLWLSGAGPLSLDQRSDQRRQRGSADRALTGDPR
jgi:uncharacterized membrane protein YphA (DoxX/SURF4 family)